MVLASGLSAGCRGSESGDTPYTPITNKYGNGTRISSKLKNPYPNAALNVGDYGFFGPAPWYQPANQLSANCPYPPEINEYVTGVTVTAVDTWDETGNGAVGTVYIQDTIGLDDWTQIPVYAGMSIFEPSYTPPDLRPVPGDVLDLQAVYEEFVGPSSGVFSSCETLPQLSGSATLRFQDQPVPPPVQIQATDLANPAYTGARQYVNMLVTVNNVCIGSTAGSEYDGRYCATVAVAGTPWQICDELWNVRDLLPLGAGQCFTSVTGIVTYFYGYQLAPRSLDDFNPHPMPMPDGGTDGG
jgi:hypothetical protein